MVKVARGATRTVLLVGRWAVKVPRCRLTLPHRTSRLHSFVRGWAANLSELEHRQIPGVAPVLWTLAGVVSIYPRAEPLRSDDDLSWWVLPTPPGLAIDRTRENVGVVDGRRPAWLDYDQTLAEGGAGVATSAPVELAPGQRLDRRALEHSAVDVEA